MLAFDLRLPSRLVEGFRQPVHFLNFNIERPMTPRIVVDALAELGRMDRKLFSVVHGSETGQTS